MKKQLLFCICALMSVFAFCNPDTDFEFDLCKSKKGNYIRITKYIGKSSSCEIPKSISGIPVKEIFTYSGYGYQAVCPRDKITQLVIPEGVEKISSKAFSDQAIKVVTIPSSVVEIGEYAFENSGLRTLNVSPRTQKLKIGQGAFEYNHLTELKLPSNVDYYFSEYVFSGNDFETFTIEPNWYGKDEGLLAKFYSGAVNYVDLRSKLQSVVYKPGCKSISNIYSKTVKTITIPKSVGTDASGKRIDSQTGKFWVPGMAASGLKYEEGAKFRMECKFKTISSSEKLKFQMDGITYSDFQGDYSFPERVSDGIFTGGKTGTERNDEVRKLLGQ